MYISIYGSPYWDREIYMYIYTYMSEALGGPTYINIRISIYLHTCMYTYIYIYMRARRGKAWWMACVRKYDYGDPSEEPYTRAYV